MGLIIQRINGQPIDISKYNLRLVEFDPDSPEYKTSYEDVESADGAIDLGTTIGIRKLKAVCKVSAGDMYDIALLRNEIFQLFHSKEAFYLIDKREMGKRWLVKVEPYTISTLRYVRSEVTLQFIAAFPFAESIGTTLSPLDIDSSIWQVGQGLTTDDPKYVHTTPSFRIYNAGVIPIDPRRMPLLITFKGASINLKIRNKTTGDEWSYTGTTTANDTIRLDRVRSTKNSLSIFRDTNRKLISIESGWNDFEITGATSPFSISFDFRFYYL
ncbi:phage tail family protein (plasmid) [Bacillus cereus]|uniref:phage tail family protein n=1 Tax=Bacillus cereus TaxID=1396 RepID=UPI001B8B3D9D|nr:phage tail family protein [Bacillus cereus]QUW34610.1 phage tail family protein [Bacillus cereus]